VSNLLFLEDEGVGACNLPKNFSQRSN